MVVQACRLYGQEVPVEDEPRGRLSDILLFVHSLCDGRLHSLGDHCAVRFVRRSGRECHNRVLH